MIHKAAHAIQDGIIIPILWNKECEMTTSYILTSRREANSNKHDAKN